MAETKVRVKPKMTAGKLIGKIFLYLALILGALVMLVPVSYTHLDVYKRQDKDRPDIHLPEHHDTTEGKCYRKPPQGIRNKDQF